MKLINEEKLILKREVFQRTEIEKRMTDGGFNSFSKFKLFIWDLEMFLQLQKKFGDKIILKGGAATQFYIPITAQRTSIDIDMICLASREEVHQAIAEIETEFNGSGDYCKFRFYEPEMPKLELNALETYFKTVPSVCNGNELFATKGKQEVKIEFIFSKDDFSISKIKQPARFALDTEETFNVLAFESLFADKLTTLGPNTIGIPEVRADEQVKQIYDVITLFISNLDQVLGNKDLIKLNYEKMARDECWIHGLTYESDQLFDDMKLLINRLKNIENDNKLLQRANDFQGLYLRRSVNRDKAQWAIAGYQLDLLTEYIFRNNKKILLFVEIEEYIKTLKFDHIRGPERGKINREVREKLERLFGNTPGLSMNLFKKRIDRILWELITSVEYQEIKDALSDIPSTPI